MVKEYKITISPKQKIITQVDEHGWETKFQYRKSMDDFIVYQKHKDSIKRLGSSRANDRMVYVNGPIVKEILKLFAKRGN